MGRIVQEAAAYATAWDGPLDLALLPLLLVRVALRQLAQIPARSAAGEVFSDAERSRLARCSEAILAAELELTRRLVR